MCTRDIVARRQFVRPFTVIAFFSNSESPFFFRPVRRERFLHFVLTVSTSLRTARFVARFTCVGWARAGRAPYRHVNGVNVLSARLRRKHAQNPRAAPHCTEHNKQEKRAVQQSKRNERFRGFVVRTKLWQFCRGGATKAKCSPK